MSHRRLLLVFILILTIPFVVSAANKGKKPTTKVTTQTDQVTSSDAGKDRVVRTTTVIGKDDKDTKASDIKAETPVTILPHDEDALPTSQTSPEAGEQINWQVISSGATDASSATYRMLGTLGQTAVGSGSSASYQILHGYWQVIDGGGGGCCGQYTGGIPGNIDFLPDGKMNLADITLLIDRVYVSKNVLLCEENGNVDNDTGGKINLADITKLIDVVYVSKILPTACI